MGGCSKQGLIPLPRIGVRQNGAPLPQAEFGRCFSSTSLVPAPLILSSKLEGARRFKCCVCEKYLHQVAPVSLPLAVVSFHLWHREEGRQVSYICSHYNTTSRSCCHDVCSSPLERGQSGVLWAMYLLGIQRYIPVMSVLLCCCSFRTGACWGMLTEAFYVNVAY